MFIGETARLTGATPKAIRLYEQLGILRPPVRRGRYRLYSAADVARIQLLKEAQHLGFSLAEIRDILAGDVSCDRIPWDRVHALVASKLQRIDHELARLGEQREALHAFAAATRSADEGCPS